MDVHHRARRAAKGALASDVSEAKVARYPGSASGGMISVLVHVPSSLVHRAWIGRWFGQS